jgi:hypothetical protein
MTKSNTSCPCCRKDLTKHGNEELLKCAFNELSKIDQSLGESKNV